MNNNNNNNNNSGNNNYHQGYGRGGHGYGSGSRSGSGEYSDEYNHNHAQGQGGYGYGDGSGVGMESYGGVSYGHQGMQMEQQQQHYDENMNMGIDMNMDVNVNVNVDLDVPPGAYFPLGGPFMPHIQKAPISALAIDPIADALHVAGHTIPLNPHHHRKRNLYGPGPGPGPGDVVSASGSGGVGGSGSGGGGVGLNSINSDQRVSMMATHNFSNGSLYAACAAHDEANHGVLHNLISCTFGINNTSTMSSSSTLQQLSKSKSKLYSAKSAQMKIPAHAYRPPYQLPIENNASTALSTVPDMNHMNKKYHVGVSKILPFCAPRGSTNASSQNSNERKDGSERDLDGYNFTVSPSAIRVHTRGGMQLSNNDQIQGMVSSTFHPNGHNNMNPDDNGDLNECTVASTATHVTIGGIAADTGSAGGGGGVMNRSLGYNLHCIDLYSDSLKPVASHAVRSDSSSTKSNNNQLCISSLATNHPTCNIIAGCSDGTLRIFDGRWRGGNYMECAKVKAHGGGVVQVATAGNLICTTGYSSTSTNAKMDSLYAFPDEHVLVFDIRFLGRGGIVHPFSGLKGGPRHISFIPALSSSSDGNSGDHRILVASGQAGGGLQIITPFDSLTSDIGNANEFINPPMDSGEAMTAMSVMGRDMAVGTNYGNVHQYRMAGYEQVVAAKSSAARTSSTRTGTIHSSPSNATAWSSHTSGGATDSNDNDSSSNVNGNLEKEDLFAPTYTEPPPLSIEPQSLQGQANFNSRFISVFNAYNLHSNPVITPTFTYTHGHGHGHDQDEGQYALNPYSFGPLSSDTLVPTCKKSLSKTLKEHVTETTKEGDDFLTSIQTSKIGLNLVGTNSSTARAKGTKTSGNNAFLKINMNKLLYGGNKIANVAYDTTDPRKKGRKGQGRDGVRARIFFYFDVHALLTCTFLLMHVLNSLYG